MPGSIILVGDKAIHQAMATMEAKLQKRAIRRALTKTTKKVFSDAKNLAPRETGTLRRSLRTRAVRNRGRSRRHKISRGVVSSAAWFKGRTFYHPFVELGTKKMAPRRHLRKALFENQRWVRESFKDELRQQIKMIARQTRTKSRNERA